MALSNDKNEHRRQADIPDCVERDNETQQKINAIKKKYCQGLNDSQNAVEQLKIGYQASEKIYKSKERRYLSTRENYQRYVNTEISMGSQLVQANEQMKTSVASYKTWDDTLAGNLKEIFNAVKDVKAKMSNLRDAAIKLENSTHDSCNASQWAIITGKMPDNCKDETKPPIETEDCKDIDDVLNLLFCMPKALLLDTDSIFKSSSDVIGLQKFINTGSLVTLQQKLYKNAKDFDDLLLATITIRKVDLDTRQTELKQALASRTGYVMNLYGERCHYSGLHKTLDKICCPKCGCVNNDIGNCEPRLEGCACEICDICGEVKDAFIREEPAPALPPAT
jgi:hypothetical protein